MTPLEEIEAKVNDIKAKYPKITTEIGDRILDCPEAVTEAAEEGVLPPGFSDKEQFYDFIMAYGDLRWFLTGEVADGIGESIAATLLSEVHSD